LIAGEERSFAPSTFVALFKQSEMPVLPPDTVTFLFSVIYIAKIREGTTLRLRSFN
jgi:hypothetical protein